MREELRDKIRNSFPETLFDHLYSEQTYEAIGSIITEYLHGDEMKIELMKDIIGLVTLREIKIEDLAVEIAIRLQVPAEVAKDISLIMLREIFFPVKDFFPGIEDAILNLGGEVPKETVRTVGEQLLKREEEIEELERQKEAEEKERLADTIITEEIEALMEKFPEVGETLIGGQKSIAVKGLEMEMKPMIKYWIRDYREKTGNYRHTNLERVQYVCHDTNTRSMNDEERRQLNLVLKSVDKEISLPYSTKRKKIDFSLVADEG
jgi:hypothetical protein